jgi:hypothetical protein
MSREGADRNAIRPFSIAAIQRNPLRKNLPKIGVRSDARLQTL